MKVREVFNLMQSILKSILAISVRQYLRELELSFCDDEDCVSFLTLIEYSLSSCECQLFQRIHVLSYFPARQAIETLQVAQELDLLCMLLFVDLYDRLVESTIVGSKLRFTFCLYCCRSLTAIDQSYFAKCCCFVEVLYLSEEFTKSVFVFDTIYGECMRRNTE